MNVIKKEHIPIDRPWLGLASYSEDARNYFYGRNREVEKLSRLIGQHTVTVLSGKSGIGKTSLLNGGLLPLMQEHYYLPIYIRVNFSESTTSIVQKVKDTINSVICEYDNDLAFSPEETLWEYFHRIKLFNSSVLPLLIFDQFEELFTLGIGQKDNISPFVTELANLIENQIPLSVQKKGDATISELSHLQEQRFRVLISLREDYLPHLEDFNRYIPSLKKSRLRLTEMSGNDALSVITKPGKHLIKEKEGLEILHLIASTTHNEKESKITFGRTSKTDLLDYSYEPFLLSLVCYRVNEDRISRKQNKITSALLENVNIHTIVQNYYESALTKVSEDTRIALETNLLTYDGHRKLVPKDDFIKRHNAQETELQSLIDSKVLRIQLWQGREQVELIHDILVSIVQPKQRNHLYLQERKKLIKKQRRVVTLLGLALGLFLVGIIAVFGVAKYLQSTRQEIREQHCDRIFLEAYRERKKENELNAFRLIERAYSADPKYCEVALVEHFNSIGKFSIFLEDHEKGGSAQKVATAYSPDSKYILTGSPEDYAVRVFSTDGKRLYPEFKEHKNEITSVSYDKNGKTVLSTSKDGLAYILSDKLTRLAPPMKHPKAVRFGSFSPDGNTIVTCSEDGYVRLWNLSGNIMDSIRGPNVALDAKYSKDGNQILCRFEHTSILIWNLDTKTVKTIQRPNNIRFLDYTSKPNQIVSLGFNENYTQFQSIGNGKEEPIKKFSHDHMINHIVFSRDGKRVVTSSEDGWAKIWGAEGQEIPLEHKDKVRWATFSPDEEYIATASFDKHVRIWDVEGRLIQDFDFKHLVYDVKYAPDQSSILATNTNGQVRIFPLLPKDILRLVNEDKMFGTIAPLEEETKQLLGL